MVWEGRLSRESDADKSDANAVNAMGMIMSDASWASVDVWL